MDRLRWLGLVASLFNSLFGGIALSFNVYSVELKSMFRFSQTQVEVVSSCFVMGITSAVVAVPLYKRFGSKVTYFVAWSLITSSTLSMRMAISYVNFFRKRSELLCLFQFMQAAGVIFGHQCAMTIAIENCPKRHTGKLTGLFTAVVGLGKLYYATIMTALNYNIGNFFLVQTVPFTVTLGICFLFHTPQAENDSERDSLTPLDDTQTQEGPYMRLGEEREKRGIMELVKSGYFHLTFWSGVIFHACSQSFMNNITHIAASVKLKHPLNTVDILSICVTFFRLTFGFIFDKYSSKRTGFILICTCYVTFIAAMILGLSCLNDVTIYVITVLASVGTGAVFSLTLTFLFAEFAKEHYFVILGMYFTSLGILTTSCQVIVGRAYDKAVLKLSPPESLFHAMYVVSIGVDIPMFVLQVTYYLCKVVKNTI